MNSARRERERRDAGAGLCKATLQGLHFNTPEIKNERKQAVRNGQNE